MFKLHHPTLITAAGGVASVALLATTYSYLTAKPRHAKASCSCGKVIFAANIPPSSLIVNQTNVLCHCRDCIGYADHIAHLGSSPPSSAVAGFPSSSSSVDFVNRKTSSVNMIQFYRSDVTCIKGEEFIKTSQLSPKHSLHRFHASCCNTPLGLQPPLKLLPIIVLYAELFEEPNEVFGKPTGAVFWSSAKPGSCKPRNMPVYDGIFYPEFLIRVASRVVLGLILGKGRGGPFGQPDPSEVTMITAKKEK